MKKRGMIYLLIAIPAASVIMGGITLYFALSGPTATVEIREAPLSKTSWREADDDR